MVTEAVPPDEGEEGAAYADPATLPEPVRARVVGLTADVLPQVAGLPPALRRVADFAPVRRARLGGRAIADALADDDDFRARVAVQVAARPGRDDDPVENAARSWLAQEDGWEGAVEIARRASGARHDRDDAELERMRARLADAEQAAKDARAKARAQLDDLKSDNATLRRKLGEVRTAERQARETAEEALRLADEARARAAGLEAGQDKELRRLRARAEQLEAELAAQRQGERRTARADRDEATVRAKLLLDVVIDAAAGLRRELALPSVSGAPADRVEASWLDRRRCAAGTGLRGRESPSVLEQLLTLPRSRLIVDGYNVSKSAWPESSLEAQRQRLLRSLAPGRGPDRGGDDGRLRRRPADQPSRSSPAPRGVKVVFSPPGRDRRRRAPRPGRGRAARAHACWWSPTTKQVRDVRASGGRTVSAATLVGLIGG